MKLDKVKLKNKLGNKPKKVRSSYDIENKLLKDVKAKAKKNHDTLSDIITSAFEIYLEE